MTNDELITHLKGYKTPSKQQQLLLILAAKADRSKTDERNLSALLKAEQAAIKAVQARGKVSAMLRSAEKSEAEATRAKDTRRKVLMGAFVLDQLERSGIGAALFICEGKRFDDWLTRQDERELFGLKPAEPQQ